MARRRIRIITVFALLFAACANADDIGEPSDPVASPEEASIVAAVSERTSKRHGSLAPLPAAKSRLASFDHSPFPYRDTSRASGRFADMAESGRCGRVSARGGVYWERETFSDRRTLLYLPKGFDARRPSLIVVYFHGNRAQLARDVFTRQQVPRQVAESGLNAVLVAPQFAVNAFDSSPGNFCERGMFARYVNEAVERLVQLHGDRRARTSLAKAPVVIVAYSGGYYPATYAARVGGLNERLRGLILLDAPYGEEDVIADWVARRRTNAFFVSAYATAARRSNRELQRQLTERGVRFRSGLPARLAPGTIAFHDAGDRVVHHDFVTRAWIRDPLKALLARIGGVERTSGASSDDN